MVRTTATLHASLDALAATEPGFRQVLEELENEAGAQFDPKVVEAFRDLMAHKGE